MDRDLDDGRVPFEKDTACEEKLPEGEEEKDNEEEEEKKVFLRMRPAGFDPDS